ncbi:MAG: 30S ribosomal protein S21 [Candidatus Brocadiales bacterium]|nr:30S ribosomal protein S21 [Candidatus Brocadiales bacterium]
MGIEVKPKYAGEPVESMLRRFKNKVKGSGILLDVKKNEFYEKPTAKRRRKKIEAKRNR